MAQVFYKPKYLLRPAREKYGRNIFFVGITQQELSAFWKKIEYRAISTQVPVEKGKTVVDIDCKSHVNRTRPEQAKEGKATETDWYDNFEITSKKGKDETHNKEYQLQLTKTKEWQVGGNLKLGATGSVGQFFMMSGGPSISPEVGISGQYKSSKTTQETSTEGHSEKLSQEYQVVDTLKVPPRTKVKARITTWAVSYEADAVTKFTVEASTKVIIRYRSPLVRLLGGFFNQIGYVTAEELFRGENEYHIDEDNILSFTRPSKVVYLGEEVEVNKERASVPEHDEESSSSENEDDD